MTDGVDKEKSGQTHGPDARRQALHLPQDGPNTSGLEKGRGQERAKSGRGAARAHHEVTAVQPDPRHEAQRTPRNPPADRHRHRRDHLSREGKMDEKSGRRGGLACRHATRPPAP